MFDNEDENDEHVLQVRDIVNDLDETYIFCVSSVASLVDAHSDFIDHLRPPRSGESPQEVFNN